MARFKLSTCFDHLMVFFRTAFLFKTLLSFTFLSARIYSVINSIFPWDPWAWLIFLSAQTMPKPIPADGISPNLHRKCCIACISGSAARIVVVEAACAIIQSTSRLLAYSFTGNPNALLLELSKLPWCQKFSVSFSLVLLKCSVFNKTPVSQQSSVSILIL